MHVKLKCSQSKVGMLKSPVQHMNLGRHEGGKEGRGEGGREEREEIDIEMALKAVN
jgi:hypothetical protein